MVIVIVNNNAFFCNNFFCGLDVILSEYICEMVEEKKSGNIDGVIMGVL